MSDLKIAEPDIGDVDVPYSQRRAGAGSTGTGGNTTTTITINNLNLPNVEQADDFVGKLQGMVGEYNGVTA